MHRGDEVINNNCIKKDILLVMRVHTLNLSALSLTYKIFSSAPVIVTEHIQKT